jgi:hypothetical protein
MGKLVLKGKKEIKNVLVDSLHQTIQALGVSKSSKKADKVLARSAKKLSVVVAKQMKKDSKKVNKMKSKTQRKKEGLVTT